MDVRKLQFFNYNGYNLNFDWNSRQGYWEGMIYLPKVSVGLYANTTIYILEETPNNDDTFSNEFSFPSGPGKITFSWDTQNTFVDEFFMFNFDETYTIKETSALIYTPNDGPDCNTLIINRFDTYDVYLDNNLTPKALPVHIAFRANEKHDATTYTRTLVMSYNNKTIARIKFYAETVEEDERLKIWNANLGYNITPEDTIMFYKSDIKEYMPDYILLNEKRKELMLEGSNIYPYIGSYKAIINAIKFFGYDNLNIIEYWRNINRNDENFGKIYHSSRYSLKKKEALTIGARRIVLPNKDYRKVNALALVYDINKPTGEIDEWELPKVKEQFAYTIEEALIKLFALRKKLNKEFMPGSSRIIDIIGEGNYFGIQSIYKVGEFSDIDTTVSDWDIDFNVYPKKYAHITDNEYFNRYISIKTNEGQDNVPLQNQMLSDMLNDSVNDYLNTNNVYLNNHTYAMASLSNTQLCDYYLKFYEDTCENHTMFKEIEDNDDYTYDYKNLDNEEYDYYSDAERFSAKVVLRCNDYSTITFDNSDLKFNCTTYNYTDTDSNGQPNYPTSTSDGHAMDWENPDIIENPGPLKYIKYCKYKGTKSAMYEITDAKEYDLYYVNSFEEDSSEEERTVYIYINNEWREFTDIAFFNIEDVYDTSLIKWTVKMSENQYDDDLKQVGITKQYESKPLVEPTSDNPDGVFVWTDTDRTGQLFLELPYIGYYDVIMEVHGQKRTKKKCIKVEPYNIEMLGFYYDIRELPKNIKYPLDADSQMYSFIQKNIEKMYGWAVSERTDFTYPDDMSVPLYDAEGHMTNTGPYYNENVDDEWYMADNLTWEMSKLVPLTKYTRYIRNGVDVKPYTWFILGYEYSKIAGKVNPQWRIRNNTTGIEKKWPKDSNNKGGRYLTLLLKKEGNYTVILDLEDKLGNKYTLSRNIIVVDKAANYKLYQTFKKDYDYLLEQNLLKELNEFNSFYNDDPDYIVPADEENLTPISVVTISGSVREHPKPQDVTITGKVRFEQRQRQVSIHGRVRRKLDEVEVSIEGTLREEIEVGIEGTVIDISTPPVEQDVTITGTVKEVTTPPTDRDVTITGSVRYEPEQGEETVNIDVEGTIFNTDTLDVDVNIDGTVKEEIEVNIDGSVRKEEVNVNIEGTVKKEEIEVGIEGTVKKEEVDVRIDGTLRQEIEVGIEGTVIEESENDLTLNTIPMVEWSRDYPDNLQVSSEGTNFPLVIFNDKDEKVDYNVSISNVNTLYQQDFTTSSCQLDIDNYSVFIIKRPRKEFNQTDATFTISSDRSDDVTFNVTGILYTEHESYVRHYIGYNATIGRDGWPFSSIQVLPYTSGSLDMDMMFVGMADGAAEISGNTVRYYENGENASDVPTIEKTYSCYTNYKYNKDGVAQTLPFDGSSMVSNMNLSVDRLYSTLSYTISPNNSDRLRFGVMRLASNDNDCLYLNTIIQESATVRIVFSKVQYYKVEYNYYPDNLILGVIDLSKTGETFRIPIQQTGKSYEIYFWNTDVQNSITITSFNGISASKSVGADNGLGGKFLRYYFTSDMEKEGSYYNDGFLITIN